MGNDYNFWSLWVEVCQILAQRASFFYFRMITLSWLVFTPGSLSCPTFGVADLFSILRVGPAQSLSLSHLGPCSHVFLVLGVDRPLEVILCYYRDINPRSMNACQPFPPKVLTFFTSQPSPQAHFVLRIEFPSKVLRITHCRCFSSQQQPSVLALGCQIIKTDNKSFAFFNFHIAASLTSLPCPIFFGFPCI